MHLQSELENYKLQVELLQEKLQRSEDNRQELEVRLDQILKKRSEHETALRSRSQRKYQQFLDEQKKRNERNRKLVEMLERIDQQAAALAARSERFKMIKLQYEFYFAKLSQSYSLKALKIPATTLRPIEKLPSSYPMQIDGNIEQGDKYFRSFNGPTTQFQTVPIPVVVPISNDRSQFKSNLAFTSTPSGVLISLSNNSTPIPTTGPETSKNQVTGGLDYSKFPIGYIKTPSGSTLQTESGITFQQHYNLEKQNHGETSPPPAMDDRPPKVQFEFQRQSLSPMPSVGIKHGDTLSNRALSNEDHTSFSLSGEKAARCDALDFNKTREKGVNSQEGWNSRISQISDMSNDDSLRPCQSLKVDILSNISPNNILQQGTKDGRIEHRGNKSNVIDFRTDGDDYIKYIKEMKETYEKNVPIPTNSPPQEQTIDNITTALQVQKIDETSVKDDEKINDIEDNEKNTSSAFPSLGGKCSMESIGDEALTKKSLENKSTENTSNADARNIVPSRDTEQITLFNGTKNSRDESAGASNRTTAIMDGGGENDNSKNTPSETNYRPIHFDKKEKMSIENIETAIYGELLPKPEHLPSTPLREMLPAGIDYKEDDLKRPAEYDTHGTIISPVAKHVEVDKQIETEVIHNKSALDVDNKQGTLEKISNSEGHEQYDSQNYVQINETDEYKEPLIEESLQQHYDITAEEQKPLTENYVNDYENYDTTEYHTNYDPNAYQYEYEQQYDDDNQAQYTSEMYNQDYSQDPYAQEYANYDQSASSEMEVSNQPYVEQTYAPDDQQEHVIGNEIEKPISMEQEPEEIKPELEISKQYKCNINEPNEESLAKKQSTPTSILSTEKHTDLTTKKKKRVNFVDSETDESTTLPKPEVGSSESDFDFSEK